jgi:hypothetical protein
MNGWIIAVIMTALGAAPIVAVCRGARAFDDEPEPQTCTDDTIEIPRVQVSPDPHMY